MRMQVRPCDAAAFDVTLYHLVPCKVWIGRPTVPKNALMDDEAHARICRCVHERLALMEHGDRVPGQQEQSINALQCRRKGSCVVELEIDCLFAFPFPRSHLFLLSGCAHALDVSLPPLQTRTDSSPPQPSPSNHPDPPP